MQATGSQRRSHNVYSIGLVCDNEIDVFIPVESLELSDLEMKAKKLIELGCSKVRLVVDVYIQKTLMEWDAGA